jgi:hypothetical protein
MFAAPMRSTPSARLIDRYATRLIALCIAVSAATSAVVVALSDRRARGDIDDVAEATRLGFDALDERLRVVEQRCAE